MIRLEKSESSIHLAKAFNVGKSTISAIKNKIIKMDRKKEKQKKCKTDSSGDEDVEDDETKIQKRDPLDNAMKRPVHIRKLQ